MSIELKSTELQKHGARFVFKPAPKPPTAPVPDASLEEAIGRVAAALATGQQESREAILHAIAVNESLVAAVQRIGKKAPEGPWLARITKRDTLGRIAEVEFTPK